MILKVIFYIYCLCSVGFSVKYPDDDANTERSAIRSRQSNSPSFFPKDDETNSGYDIIDSSYVDPQSLYKVTASYSVVDDAQPTYPPLGEKRQGLVFDESPPGVSTFQSDQSQVTFNRNPYEESQYSGPNFTPSSSDPNYGSASSQQFTSSSSSLSEPFYQNYGSDYPTGSGNYAPVPSKAQTYPGVYSQRPQRPVTYSPSGPGKKYPNRYQSNKYYSSKYPSRYQSSYPPGTYPGKYPQGTYSQAASSSYPNYYHPNRYASQSSGYYSPQQGSYYYPPTGASASPSSAAQQHASLYYPNKQSPYPFYQPNYAHQYGNYRPTQRPTTVNGLASGILNNIQNGQFGAVGSQFSKALEDISENDDLQCVPKLVCQMIGNPRRQSQLPSFMNSPAVTALIAALPSNSPLMNFGRAALLGLAGGEGFCDNAYPRCPRNEDDLLFYLNNHRGGFFRFFNGGAGFGDENQLQSLQQTQQSQQSQPSYDTGSTSQGLNLFALQTLANAINQGGGINLGGGNRPSQNQQSDQSGSIFSALSPSTLGSLLSNLGGGSNNPADQSAGILSALGPGALSTLASNLGFGARPTTQSTPTQSSGGGFFDSSTLSSLVSNLLTGVVGNRYSRRSKRSIDANPVIKEQIEPRIVNLKPSEIAAEQINFPQQTVVNRQPKFFEDSSQTHQQQLNNIRHTDDSVFVIPNNPRETVIKSNLHNVKLTFPADNEPQDIRYELNNNVAEFLSPQDVAKRLQVLFDRTGTGSLGFDSDILKNVEMLKQVMTIIRLGRILNGVQQPSQNYNQNSNSNKYSSTSSYNQNQAYLSSSNSNNNRYTTSPNRYSNSNNYNNNNQNYQTQSQRYTPNRYSNSNSNYYNQNNDDKSHILYITNAQGVIEYTLNEKTGEKKPYYK